MTLGAAPRPFFTISTKMFCEKLRDACRSNGFLVPDGDMFSARCQMDLGNRGDGFEIDMGLSVTDFQGVPLHTIWKFGTIVGQPSATLLAFPKEPIFGMESHDIGIQQIRALANKNNCTKYGGTGGGKSTALFATSIKIERRPVSASDDSNFQSLLMGVVLASAAVVYQFRHPVAQVFAVGVWTLLGVDPSPSSSFLQRREPEVI